MPNTTTIGDTIRMLLSVTSLRQHVTLHHRATSRTEAFVDLPFDGESVDFTMLDEDLAAHGLELMSDDEAEPELTENGLRFYCADRQEGMYVVNFDGAVRAS